MGFVLGALAAVALATLGILVALRGLAYYFGRKF